MDNDPSLNSGTDLTSQALPDGEVESSHDATPYQQDETSEWNPHPLTLDDLMIRQYPADDYPCLPSSELQLLPPIASKEIEGNGPSRLPSLPFEDLISEYSPLGMEVESFPRSTLCSDPMEPKAFNYSSGCYSFADPLDKTAPSVQECGPLPYGSIRSFSLTLNPVGESITDVSRAFPLPDGKAEFSMFDDPFCGTSGETLPDSNPMSASASVFSDTGAEESYSDKKRHTKNKKKWKCSNCHYINNLSKETKGNNT